MSELAPPVLDSWPPPYQVRHSKRAKNLQLRITIEDGLQVVVPERQAHVNVEEFINLHQRWIKKKLLQFPHLAKPNQGLPTAIALRAVNQVWQVNTEKTAGKLHLLTNADYTLTLLGDTDEQQCQQKLQAWMKYQARQHLVPWLMRLSAETGLHYKSVNFRQQKTCWGSCSAKSHISLNTKLLFLPPAVVRYVLVHELCHLKHMNHSKLFWQLVAQYHPNYLHDRRELQRWGRKMSLWGEVLL